MDSVYNLIIHEDHYKQDKLYALNITLDYARFLNQKGDSERANTLLTQIRDNAMALESLLTTLKEYHRNGWCACSAAEATVQAAPL